MLAINNLDKRHRNTTYHIRMLNFAILLFKRWNRDLKYIRICSIDSGRPYENDKKNQKKKEQEEKG